MAPKFGTSGLRGLVTELTGDLVADYVQAFAAVCDVGDGICVARDLRESSGRIAGDVMRAAADAGLTVVDCGQVPTPAVALAAGRRNMAAVMVTGSHIPADRNGLKFYTVKGEITKRDEANITRALGMHSPGVATGTCGTDDGVGQAFVDRYVSAFGGDCLSGLKIGVYTHSAVGREILAEILRGLGAEVLEFGRSDHFIPIDTEALDGATLNYLSERVHALGLDAAVSTDGDSDRPLLIDDKGRVVPGDLLGQISAEMLGAHSVVTPVTSNSGVENKGIHTVIHTRIGSPYVIEGMMGVGGRVVGYEANGGFLLGFEAAGLTGTIPPLMTRDSILPILLTLMAGRDTSVSQRVAREPDIVAASDRIQNVSDDVSAPIMRKIVDDSRFRQEIIGELGTQKGEVDVTDGVRLRLDGNLVVHFRQSGNAPEFRIYVQCPASRDAGKILAHLKALMARHTGTELQRSH